MNALVPFPVVVALAAAALCLAFHRRPQVQRIVALVAMAVVFAASIVLLIEVERNGTVAVQAGAWPAPIGITLVADLFASILLCTALGTVLAVLVYSIGSRRTDDRSLFFHPVYLVLAAGVSLSFLAGDLFNLFVAFEVMLIASYVLLTFGGRAAQVRAGMTYVVISLVASALFVMAIAFIYAATGTVNMADLAGQMDQVPSGLRDALGLLLLVVFGIKAAIFPLFFWLPDAYPTAPSPVTAIFAGLLTKVGVYAIIRSQTLLFPSDGPDDLLLAIAGITMVVGVLGAIAQSDIKRILSFHIVSQIGYMVFGLALFTVAGVAGAIFFVMNQIVVKTTLFLVGGLVEEATGTNALKRLGGLARTAPFIAILFLLAALSLAGIPPLSGFVAKLALVDAGLAADAYLVVGASLLASVLTLFSMTKIWAGTFWGAPVERPSDDQPAAAHRWPALMVGPTAALVAVSIFIALAAGPIYDMTDTAAQELISRDGYVEAVLGR